MSSVAGVHSLVTGLNGMGKTLIIVADKLRPMVGTKLRYERPDGTRVEVERRLVVSGVRDLMLPHEVMDVPEVDPERWVDRHRRVRREPGEAPVTECVMVQEVEDGKTVRYLVAAGDEVGQQVLVLSREPVVRSIVNWWLWVMPGDVIFVDEAQRAYRPMASGRRVPMYIEKAETARHYGAQFIYATQSPNLLHANLRALIGPHEEVARMFGTSRTVIYQWPRVSDVRAIKVATKRTWKHDKSAFGLYKSAELHTNFRQRLPFAMWVLVASVVALPLLAWRVYDGMQKRANPSGTVATAAPGQAGQAAQVVAAKPVAPVEPVVWPVVEARAAREVEEPLAGRGIQWEGGYAVEGRRVEYFGLVVAGDRVGTLTLAQLSAMGYAWTLRGPCVGVLQFGALVRQVTCAAKSVVPSEVATAKPSRAPPS